VMAGEHPSELTLLAYVEGELEGDERASVEAHLTVCESCAADVALARQGREAVRATPLLELPGETRERMLAALPPQRAEWRASGRRWLAVAAPVAAGLALVGGIATLAVVDGGGGDGAGGDAAQAVEESAEGGGAATEDAGADTGGGIPAPSSSALKSVAAEPRELARELRRQGFEARVERRTVVVRTSKVDELERLLEDYPTGAVRVRVEP
jgi:anti-sigma factor RsiW